ncbi:MAG TPA: TauD/TfdA family dioxygenase [Alphaproteobacteria bacterium]|nr:TauD/TfdA family dioxygenase [Alphaproteobacteria bacterium]
MTAADQIPLKVLSEEHPGAIVQGLNCEDIGPHNLEALKKALAEHGVLAFRGQKLSPASMIAFAQQFGELENSTREDFLLPGYEKIYVLSNVKDENGKPIGNADDGYQLHTDQYFFEHPTAYTLLYCLEAPPVGSDTIFCSTLKLYEGMSDEEKRKYIDMTIMASHDKLNGGRHNTGAYADYPDIPQPVVRRHPHTGRDFLYFSAKLSARPAPGMTEPEVLAMIDDLRTRASAEGKVYAHKWQAGDLVIWDNRGLLHAATPFDKVNHRRICYRLSVKGERPIRGGDELRGAAVAAE